MKIDPEKLKIAIEKSGVTARQLSEAAGWASPRRVYQLLAGKGTNTNLCIGKAIAKKLKVKTADIVMGSREAERKNK
jgi:hypothetical protein